MRFKRKKYPLNLFYRQLSMLIGFGNSLPESISILADETGEKEILKLDRKIQREMKNNVSLPEIIVNLPAFFSPLVSNLIKHETEKEKLSKLFLDMANRAEIESDLNGYIKRLFAYPTIVLVITIVVVIVFYTFIAPVFTSMYEQSGFSLPSSTKLMIDFSEVIANNILEISICLIPLIYLTVKHTFFRQYVFNLLPSLRKLNRVTYMAHFLRTMDTALSAKISLAEAVLITIDSSNHYILNKRIKKISQTTEILNDLKVAFEKSKLLKKREIHMLSIGFRTNNIPMAISELAKHYEKQLAINAKSAMDRLMTYTIIVLGLCVGYFVISMYLPIFDIAI